MEKCYEFFNCKNTDCEVRKHSDKHCWGVVGNRERCLYHLGMDASDFDDTKETCEMCCIYYEYAKKEINITKPVR